MRRQDAPLAGKSTCAVKAESLGSDGDAAAEPAGALEQVLDTERQAGERLEFVEVEEDWSTRCAASARFIDPTWPTIRALARVRGQGTRAAKTFECRARLPGRGKTAPNPPVVAVRPV